MKLPTLTDKHPPIALQKLVACIRDFSRMQQKEQFSFIDEVVQAHPVLSFRWGGGHRFRRVRQISSIDQVACVNDVIWPKIDLPKLQRLNLEGYPVLYLAADRDTALTETKVTNGLVAIAEFEIRDGCSVLLSSIGEMFLIARTGRGRFAGETSNAISQMLNACPKSEARSLLLADAFLHEQISLQDNYNISAYIAHAIRSKAPAVSAIAYPSRPQQSAINLAVDVATFWNSWGITSVRCASANHLAYGIYELSSVRNVVSIYDSGRFKWADNLDREEAVETLAPPFYLQQ
jgi:hypothetical protein